MIHMRDFTQFERNNMSFLVNHNIDFTLVQITATGLKKSIMDATLPIRTFLVEKGIHNFADQKQGTEHKVMKPTYILDETSKKNTKMSLYRPVTKKGDPRLWVYGLTKFTHADDIHSISFFDGRFVIINITRVDIRKCCESEIITPLKEYVEEVNNIESEESTNLLNIFRSLSNQWHKAEILADTGIGRTIESLLGIPQNSYTGPDYHGIELKSSREKKSSKKNVLFTQTPQWDISKLKSGREIVQKYGYMSDGHLTYQSTVQCNNANAQGLLLSLDKILELLELQHKGVTTSDVAVWRMQKLHQRLREKHHETFWIEVENEIHDNNEYFRFKSIEHTKNPVVSQFDVLLENSNITVDLSLCRPSGHGDTYSFKIKKKAMPLLFPESSFYNLLNPDLI